ncbi:MAG: hypothetical protein JWO30_845 [Fibrobacteres bacterium]|nr:hypothetical protein [Fibrobacterota bacterium]
MRIDKKDVPVRIEAPGATARLLTGFGDSKGYTTMSGEYFSLAAGTDIAPLLVGLEGDSCHAPHWGYMAEGVVIVTYRDGSTEEVKAGDMFYWPPGHSVRVEKDAEVIMFSPQHEHIQVLDHMKAKMGG